MIGPIIAVVGWLVGLAFAVITAVKGLRGGPVRLPFRGGGGQMTLTGTSARVVGFFATMLALLMLSLPVLIAMGRSGMLDR